MHNVVEYLGTAQNIISSVAVILMMVALIAGTVRLLDFFMKVLGYVEDYLKRLAAAPPPEPRTYTSVSEPAPSFAHPAPVESVPQTETPPPEGSIEVCCKKCRKTNWLCPVSSEVKANKVILQFECPDCGHSFGRLADS